MSAQIHARPRRHGGEARGNSRDRASRKRWLLCEYGNCQYAQCALQISPDCPVWLTSDTVTADRIVPGANGGSYRHENIRPACLPCNQMRGARW